MTDASYKNANLPPREAPALKKFKDILHSWRFLLFFISFKGRHHLLRKSGTNDSGDLGKDATLPLAVLVTYPFFPSHSPSTPRFSCQYSQFVFLSDLQRFSTISTGYDSFSTSHSPGNVFLKTTNRHLAQSLILPSLSWGIQNGILPES